MSVLAALRHRRLQRRLAAPRLLRAFADAYPEARFVEIGSNDGHQHDHLRPFILSRGWRGVMVEPLPYVFERLVRNYEGVAGVALENAAISDRDGTVPFYYPVPPASDERDALPDWYDGIGSFSREAVLSHAAHIPDIERRVVRAEVTVAHVRLAVPRPRPEPGRSPAASTPRATTGRSCGASTSAASSRAS